MDTMLTKNLIETEYSHGTDAKKTWLKCQGCEYEANPAQLLMH